MENSPKNVRIEIKDHGPYVVRGSFEIMDETGEMIEVPEAISLCRCGNSRRAPFCDGAHNAHRFRDESRVSN